MNYYKEIGASEDKVGKFSALLMLFAVLTLIFTIIESMLFIVSFAVFVILFIINTMDRRKLKKLEKSIFNEYAEYMVNTIGFDEVSKIHVDKFFTARATSNKIKFLKLYDADLEISNDDYIKLLLSIEKSGMEEYSNNEFNSEEFDVAAYVKLKISQL